MGSYRLNICLNLNGIKRMQIYENEDCQALMNKMEKEQFSLIRIFEDYGFEPDVRIWRDNSFNWNLKIDVVARAEYK